MKFLENTVETMAAEMWILVNVARTGIEKIQKTHTVQYKWVIQ